MKIPNLIHLEDVKRLTRHARTYLEDIKLRELFVLGETVSYLESGEGEPVLMLHGYNGNVHVMRSLLSPLARTHRVIALEVPGLAYRSRMNRPKRFSGRFIMDFIDESAQKLGLGTFELLGVSAGATFAATYALHNEAKVKSLAMIGMPSLFGYSGPDGPDSAKEAELDFYVPTTLEGVQELTNLMYSVPPVIPVSLQKGFIQYNVDNMEFRKSVLREIYKRNMFLVPKLGKLKMPSIFIYGENDKVTPQRTVDYLLANVRNIQSYKVLRSGHSIYIENPEEVAAAYRSFLRYSDSGSKVSHKQIS